MRTCFRLMRGGARFRAHCRETARTVAVAMLISTLLVAPVTPAYAQEGAVRVADLSPEAEQAIDRGLAYLAGSQNEDGSWGGPAHTAVVLMAFMLKGYFPDPDRPDRHGQRLDRAVQFLLNQSRQHGGYFGGNMYHHALATLALAEAWGMSQRDEIRDAVKSGVEVILRAQHSSGGWRYQPMPVDHDTSVTAMVVVALAAAHEAGILVPREVMARATEYLKGRQTEEGGFGYRGPRDPGFARSAASTLALQLGGARNDEAVQNGLRYLMQTDAETAFDNRHFFYAQYYAIQAMYQAGERPYAQWQPRIHDLLIQRQNDNGSWNAGHGNPFGTAMAILILGVPYRYLPIYQR
ncbi:MAG: prenyltransferase/squalene oxidase repeat-containing protein [Phycisphaeraceae bacterium]